MLYCFDVQDIALQKTREALQAKNPLYMDRVHLEKRNHRNFPEYIRPSSVKLIVYNLGYLPGGNKDITTQGEDSIESIVNALDLLQPRGLLSVLCYRMHSEDAMEETKDVEAVLTSLDPQRFRSFAHYPINWPLAPLLITTYKLPGGGSL